MQWSNPPRSKRPFLRGNRPTAWLVAMLVATTLVSGVARAKDIHLIREHVLAQFAVSTDPLDGPALRDLLTAPVYLVAIEGYGSGESLAFMAVHDGEVLRLYRHGLPNPRETLLRLLPDDFRVQSEADAKRLVAAAMALHTRCGRPDKSLDEMRLVTSDGQYMFVDGERLGDATGYRTEVDGDGRVIRFECSNGLPVDVREGDA